MRAVCNLFGPLTSRVVVDVGDLVRPAAGPTLEEGVANGSAIVRLNPTSGIATLTGNDHATRFLPRTPRWAFDFHVGRDERHWIGVADDRG